MIKILISSDEYVAAVDFALDSTKHFKFIILNKFHKCYQVIQAPAESWPKTLSNIIETHAGTIFYGNKEKFTQNINF